MKQEKDTESPSLHLQRQQLLLRMEYEYEKEEFRRQTETMGVARKVKRGLCWFPATAGRSYYNSLNQLVLEITRTEDIDIEHNFEYGRPVCFFHQTADGSLSYYNFQGTVSYADDTRMVVVMPGAGSIMDIQGADRLGVQLYFDETSYRTMFEALTDVLRAKSNRLAELRDTLLGTLKPGFRELYPVRFPWLNQTQESAVNKVLCTRDVAIVHGPPGTGKTTTLVEAIYETLHREPQVLVCAQSNTAVDWISEKLVDRGVSVLRIGNPTRVNDKCCPSPTNVASKPIRPILNCGASAKSYVNYMAKPAVALTKNVKECAAVYPAYATEPQLWKFRSMPTSSTRLTSLPPP